LREGEEVQMNRRILVRMACTLAMAVLPACALAQAAAESALTHASSAAATAKAGSALNSAMDRSSKKLAGRVQQQVSPPAPGAKSQVRARPASTTSTQATAPREGSPPAKSSMIASIQGGEAGCVARDVKAPEPESKTDAEPEEPARSGQECAAKPAPQEHKSVITVSFSK
jgi:hypothetical protein